MGMLLSARGSMAASMRSDRAKILELVALVVGVSAVGMLLDGAAFWLTALGLGIATAFASFSYLLEFEPRGVPIESLAAPTVAAFGALSAGHLVGVGWLAIPVLAGCGGLVGLSLALERRLLGPNDAVAARRRNQLVQLTLLLAFVAFAGVAGAIPGGLAESSPGVPAPPLNEGGLLQLALADAVVAFLLGYRLSAMRAPTVREAAWAAGTFAVIIAVAAAALRALAIPRLLGPAVLAVVFYLWSAYRAAPGSERRSASWLWEYGILALAAVLVIAWNVLVH